MALNELFVLWWRAFSVVSLTALNVTQVSQGNYLAAFFTGTALSFVWWMNTRTAANSTLKGGQIAYAVGAGCGTVFGMFLGRMFRG